MTIHLLNEERALAEAKLDALISGLTAAGTTWTGWEPTPRLMLAYADLAAAVRRHLAAA